MIQWFCNAFVIYKRPGGYNIEMLIKSSSNCFSDKKNPEYNNLDHSSNVVKLNKQNHCSKIKFTLNTEQANSAVVCAYLEFYKFPCSY